MALRHVSEYATTPGGILAYARDARDYWQAMADNVPEGPTAEWDRGFAHGKEMAFQTVVEMLDGTERSRREPKIDIIRPW